MLMQMRSIRRTMALCLVVLLLSALAAPVVSGALRRTVPAIWPVDGMDPPPRKYIALTFDDGPRRKTTVPLLDGLAERGVKATFFLIGRQVEPCSDLVRRMQAEGHQVGLHTNSHIILSGISHATYDEEMGGNRAVLEEILGPEPFMIRPPYGMTDPQVRSWTSSPLICWSIDTEDWKDKNVERVVDLIRCQAKDGAIILMHDIYPTSVDAALQAVDALMAEGYIFVTVEQLFALRAVEPQAGKVYEKLTP